MGRRERRRRRLIRKKGGEGGYLRIQNKSDIEVEIKIVEGRNVDDMGMDKIVGIIGPGKQLPTYLYQQVKEWPNLDLSTKGRSKEQTILSLVDNG